MPQARVLTITCPAAGLGSGMSSATISPFLKMAARMGTLGIVRASFSIGRALTEGGQSPISGIMTAY
jgi:hypothetical protein